MCAGDLALRELVEAQRKPLGQPPVVDEDDRRVVLLDQTQKLRVDRGPDGVALPRLTHVFDRDDHTQVELLRSPRVHELDVSTAGDETADLLQRPLSGGEPDALKRLTGQPL